MAWLQEECDLRARRGILRSALDPEWTKLWAEGTIAIADNADNADMDAIIEAMQGYLRRHRHVLLKARKVQRLADTGADCDAMSSDHLALMKGKGVLRSRVDQDELLDMAGGELKSHGIFPMTLKRGGDQTYDVDVHMLDKATAPILSKQGCIALGLIPEGWPKTVAKLSLEKNKGNLQAMQKNPVKETEADSAKEKLVEFPTVFADDTEALKTMSAPPMNIELEANAQPMRVYKAYSIPLHWQEKVTKQWIVEDVPTDEVPEWTHPMRSQSGRTRWWWSRRRTATSQGLRSTSPD